MNYGFDWHPIIHQRRHPCRMSLAHPSHWSCHTQRNKTQTLTSTPTEKAQYPHPMLPQQQQMAALGGQQHQAALPHCRQFEAFCNCWNCSSEVCHPMNHCTPGLHLVTVTALCCNQNSANRTGKAKLWKYSGYNSEMVRYSILYQGLYIYGFQTRPGWRHFNVMVSAAVLHCCELRW